jgi:hypothetical protein
MDEQLKAMTENAVDAEGRVTIAHLDPVLGRLAIGIGTARQEYTLKPLDQLYGAGTGRDSFDPEDEEFTALLMAIEAELSASGKDDRQLTDGDALLALKALSMNPAADVGGDILAARIQASLRLCLSLNNYSRQDVKMAIRKVTQSVQRHTRLAGRRGYLDFIKDYA